FRNHGLLDIFDRPQWQTVVGGSHAYIKAFLKGFCGQVRLRCPIAAIRRDSAKVRVITLDGTTLTFDRVVMASHADETLKMLADPSKDEQRLLGAWTYSRNRTYLHTDASALPPNRRAWASWNYTREPGRNGDSPVTVTYHMNRLQGLRTRDEYC